MPRNQQKMMNNLNSLVKFQQLPYNWNGYGASAFSDILIEKVKNIIVGLTIQPDIFPTGRGSIQLEYETDNGDYMEFEVFADHISMLRIDSNGEIEGEIGESEISGLVDSFYAC